MSVRAKANNLAKKLGIAPQAALQAWFAERFLARVAMSGHADRIVVKGGTLMAALFGLAERTTMDIDATVLDTRGDEATLRGVLAEICAVDASDGISFALGSGETIRKDDEYGGVGFTLVATLGTIRLTLGIDMTVGDAIVPGPEPLEGSGLFGEAPCIRLWAYPTETLLAEKLQTLLKRGELTTRPRDFYDIHKIVSAGRYRPDVFRTAVAATFARRDSLPLLARKHAILDTVARSRDIHSIWQKYRRQFPYARDIPMETAIKSIRHLLSLLD